jgi:hypothetical protein
LLIPSQASLAGTFELTPPSGSDGVEDGLGMWKDASMSNKNWREAHVAAALPTKQLSEVHSAVLNKNAAGASGSALTASAAPDSSVHGQNMRIAHLQATKGVINKNTGINTFELPTVVIHTHTQGGTQRTKNEAHVLELVVGLILEYFPLIVFMDSNELCCKIYICVYKFYPQSYS